MPIPIKSTREIAEKWKRVTPGRSRDYELGVSNPRISWEEATLAGADNWVQGIQQAIADGRYTRGVAAAGDAKWQRKSIEKGVPRWGQGVAMAEDDYQGGFDP